MKVPDMGSPNAPMPGPVKHGWVQCAADWPSQAFMPLYDAASMQRIGVEGAFPTFRLASDAIDAVPFGHRIRRADLIVGQVIKVWRRYIHTMTTLRWHEMRLPN